jgi:putative ABC transport system permease protein
MEQFFRWPLETIALTLALAVGALLLGYALLVWRAPLLPRLGIRNIGRRPLRAALIVGGLMLSTTVIGSAFATGDAITHTFHTLVTGSLGTVDEVVVLNPSWRYVRGRVQALTQPGLAQSTAGLGGARLEYFDQSLAEPIIQSISGSAAIAGVAPAIVEQVGVIHGPSQQLQSAISLLAVAAPLSPETQQAFGVLTTAEGQPVALEALGPDEIVINAAAAASLRATTGDTLAILRGDTTWNARIRAVANNGGIAGSQPLILLSLAHYQRTAQRPGLINQLLVANRGGTASVAQSAAAARELRVMLVDRAAAQELHDLLSRPDIQRGLREAEGLLEGRDLQRIVALREAAAQPQMTDEFVSLISEPRIRQRLLALGRWMPGTIRGPELYRLLQTVSRLSVLEIKQEALDQAQEYGAVVTTVFLVLGLFSIVASILLIFLIFALLAADRGAELATMRAMGMRRWQIMGLFLCEGLIYDLLGALLGMLASLIGGYAIVGALTQALVPFGVRLEPHITLTSLVISGGGGILLTFGAMLFAAWRVSRVAIVAGTRGELAAESQRWLLGLGALLFGIAWLVWRRWQPSPESYQAHPLLLVPAVLSLLLLGLLCCLRPLLSAVATARPMIMRSVSALTGLAIGGVWLRLLLRLPAERGSVSQSALAATVAGVALIVTTVWTATQGLGPLLRMLDWSLTGVARLRAVVRPAVGYLGQQRWRTGLTVVMFGMVVCIMVVALTLIDVVIGAYGNDEPPIAGYDLRGDGALGNLDAALAEATAVSRASFTAIGSVAKQDAAIVQLGLPQARWQDATLAIVDDGFVAGIRAGMEQRAGEYDDDAAVWAALREQPGTAIVTGRLPQGMVVPQPATDRLSFSLWARLPTSGAPVKLTVIGVVDPRSNLDAGVYISQATAQRLGAPLAPPQSYFFAVAPGVQLRDAAEGLRISFGAQGFTVSVLDETLKIVQAVRLLLVRLVQGFMGLGLIAGIAALGLLGVQSVLERRQQFGALRALGFTRAQIRATCLFESSLVAGLGIAVGITLGLMLSRSLVTILAAGYPELRFVIPWPEIALTATTAWIGALGAILLAAWQAGRIAPAEALRVA